MSIISDYFSPDSTLYPGSGLTFYVFDYSKVGSFVQDCLIPFSGDGGTGPCPTTNGSMNED